MMNAKNKKHSVESFEIKSISTPKCPLENSLSATRKIIKRIEKSKKFDRWLVDPMDIYWDTLGSLGDPKIQEFPSIKLLFVILCEEKE